MVVIVGWGFVIVSNMSMTDSHAICNPVFVSEQIQTEYIKRDQFDI